MLSRIAESLFWIGRYLERAEDTSRLLDVHLLLLLEDPVVDEETTSRVLLQVMGLPEVEVADHQTVQRLLGWDEGSASSMVAAFYGARESARRSRETVSTEVWETVNTAWNMMSGNRLQHLPAHRACQLVRERCALVGAVADTTMSHDDAWRFLVLGRSLERVDMTSRLIESAAHHEDSPHAWATTLRACGAHHAFLRTHRGVSPDERGGEFLMTDRLFPRSILFSLGQAEEALAALEARERRSAAGEGRRLLGRARAELEYGHLEDLMGDLPSRMTALQRMCGRVSDEVAQRYFDATGQAVWRAGAR